MGEKLQQASAPNVMSHGQSTVPNATSTTVSQSELPQRPAARGALSLKSAAKAVGASLKPNASDPRLNLAQKQLRGTTTHTQPNASSSMGGGLTLASLRALPFIQAIQDIFDGKGLEAFLNDLSPRDLVHYITNHCAHIQSDERKLSVVGQRLANVPATSENQAAFSSVPFREALLGLIVSAKKLETVYWLGSGLITVTTSAHNTRLFSYRPLRNALVHLAWHAKSPPTVEVVSQLFARFGEAAVGGSGTGGGGDPLLFATAAVRDAFCCMSEYAVTSAAIVWWSTALLHVMAIGKESEVVFTVAEIRGTVYKVAKVADSVEGVVAVCGLITSFVFSEEGKRLMGSRVTVETLLHLATFATAPEAVESWCKALLHFASDNDNRQLCATSTIHDAFVRLTPFAETLSAIESLCRAIAGLALLKELELMLCSREVRRAFHQLSTVIRHHVNTARKAASHHYSSKVLSPRSSSDNDGEQASVSAALWLCNAVINLTSTDLHKSRFSHEDIRDLLLDLAVLLPSSSSRDPPVATSSIFSSPPPELVVAIAHVIFNITRFTEKPHLFAVRPFRTLLFSLSKEARDSATALYVLGAIGAITRDDENRIACGDGRMKDCLVTLSDLVHTPEAALRWWKAISQICVLEVNRSNFSLDNEAVVKALLRCMRASRSADAIIAMGKAMDVLFASHYREDDGRQRLPPSMSARSGVVSPSQGPGRLGDLAGSSQAQLLRASTITPIYTSSAYDLPVVDVRDALLSVHTHATHADSVSWLAKTMFALAVASGGDNGQFGCALLCTKEVHNAITLLAQHAQHSDAVRWVCKLLNLLGRDPTFRELLASKPLQKALVHGCKPHAKTHDSVQFLSDALSLVSKCLEDSTFTLEGNSEAGLGSTLDNIKEPRQRVYQQYFYQEPPPPRRIP